MMARIGAILAPYIVLLVRKLTKRRASLKCNLGGTILPMIYR